jgi:hypothetical protein
MWPTLVIEFKRESDSEANLLQLIP